jgi:hypothetical protein
MKYLFLALILSSCASYEVICTDAQGQIVYKNKQSTFGGCCKIGDTTWTKCEITKPK